jgi:hypothetical protein
MLFFLFMLCLSDTALTQQQFGSKKSDTVSEESDISQKKVAVTGDSGIRKEVVRQKVLRSSSGDNLDPTAVPTTMNYQGLLEENGVPATGTKSMLFRLFNSASGGSECWSESSSVTLEDNGLFNVMLGEVTPIAGCDFSEQLFLEIEVEGEVLSERQALSSVPYAMVADDAARSANSDLLDGMDSSAFAESSHGHDGSYYTETELNTSDGSGPNTGANRVHWDILTGMPTDFSDGVDNTGGDGDITGVSAGNGLTGGGTSGDVTLGIRVHGVTGLEIAADAVGDSELQDEIEVSVLTAEEIWANSPNSNGIRGFTSGTTNWAGVYGRHDNGGYGIIGQTSGTGVHSGVYGHNENIGGTGIIARGNDQTAAYLPEGSGLAAVGSQWGVYGLATSSSGSRAGGNFDCSSGPYAVVAYVSSLGSQYKIQGEGSVLSVMPTTAGRVALIAPESPEAWVQDFGTGRIINGRASVDLDPTFVECATISDKYPMKVFITFTSPPPDGYYVSKGTDGFEVISTSGENTNATFDYFVSVRWKGWEDVRFEPADPRPQSVQVANLAGIGREADNIFSPSGELRNSVDVQR